jgi:hypothetical protein
MSFFCRAEILMLSLPLSTTPSGRTNIRIRGEKSIKQKDLIF